MPYLQGLFIGSYFLRGLLAGSLRDNRFPLFTDRVVGTNRLAQRTGQFHFRIEIFSVCASIIIKFAREEL